MKRRAVMNLTIMLCVFLAGVCKAENRLLLTGSDWCPYICTKIDDPQKLSPKPGYLVDILHHALEKYTLHYESPSWERAILETRKGTYDAIVGIYISVAADLIYPKTNLGYSRMCFYVNQDNPWKFNGIESLSEITLGVIEGYFYDEGVVDAYINTHSNNPTRVEAVPGTRGIIQNLEKLRLGRISAILDEQQVVEYTIRSHKLENRFKPAGCLTKIPVQIGFTPAKPASHKHAERIAKAIAEMRASGKLRKILNRYGIRDWQPQ